MGLSGNRQCPVSKAFGSQNVYFWSVPHPVPLTWELEEPGLEEGPRRGKAKPALEKSFLMTEDRPDMGVELDIKVGPVTRETPGVKAGNGDEGRRESKMVVSLTGVPPSCGF